MGGRGGGGGGPFGIAKPAGNNGSGGGKEPAIIPKGIIPNIPPGPPVFWLNCCISCGTIGCNEGGANEPGTWLICTGDCVLPREVGAAPICCCTCGTWAKKGGAPVSPACCSSLGLFGLSKPGGPAQSSPEGEPPFMEAACSAARDEKMEDSTCWPDDKDASLSAIAAAVILGSSPIALVMVGGEVAGCTG